MIAVIGFILALCGIVGLGIYSILEAVGLMSSDTTSRYMLLCAGVVGIGAVAVYLGIIIQAVL